MKNRYSYIAALLGVWTVSGNAANFAYVEVNSNRFENAGCYIDSVTRQPFFQMASVFAANINGNNPNEPIIFLNPQVSETLQSSQVKNLRKKGIKVLVTLLGNHQNAGWSCMTDVAAAKIFADNIVKFVNQYDLDGIDIDDEYSKCTTNNYSMIMVAQAIKAHPGFQGKLLTKALYGDYDYFQAKYKGRKLSEYLDYGMEMTYSEDDFMGRLQPYIKAGMPFSRLMLGTDTKRSFPDPFEIGKFTARYTLAGLMAFDVNTNSLDHLSTLQQGYSNNRATVDVEPGCLK